MFRANAFAHVNGNKRSNDGIALTSRGSGTDRGWRDSTDWVFNKDMLQILLITKPLPLDMFQDARRREHWSDESGGTYVRFKARYAKEWGYEFDGIHISGYSISDM